MDSYTNHVGCAGIIFMLLGFILRFPLFFVISIGCLIGNLVHFLCELIL